LKIVARLGCPIWTGAGGGETMEVAIAADAADLLVPKLSLLSSVVWRASTGTVVCCFEHEC
jgi:hypothetical protein